MRNTPITIDDIMDGGITIEFDGRGPAPLFGVLRALNDLMAEHGTATDFDCPCGSCCECDNDDEADTGYRPFRVTSDGVTIDGEVYALDVHGKNVPLPFTVRGTVIGEVSETGPILVLGDAGDVLRVRVLPVKRAEDGTFVHDAVIVSLNGAHLVNSCKLVFDSEPDFSNAAHSCAGNRNQRKDYCGCYDCNAHMDDCACEDYERRDAGADDGRRVRDENLVSSFRDKLVTWEYGGKSVRNGDGATVKLDLYGDDKPFVLKGTIKRITRNDDDSYRFVIDSDEDALTFITIDVTENSDGSITATCYDAGVPNNGNRLQKMAMNCWSDCDFRATESGIANVRRYLSARIRVMSMDVERRGRDDMMRGGVR